LRGSEAVRVLAPHLVRHVRSEPIDRRLFAQLVKLAQVVPVLSTHLVSGHSYVACLAAELARHGFPPRRKSLDARAPARSGVRSRSGETPWR
jgi:hypothetical protein